MAKKLHAVEANEALLEALLKGDERAPLKIGWRIVKIAGDEGDISPIGEKGEVLGSMFSVEVGAAYLVKWDNFPAPVIVVGWKIKKDLG